MVHALHEARRVLKTDGYLIDLRPMAIHRRVEIWWRGDHKPIGSMREKFDGDLAADKAMRHVLDEGSFRLEKRLKFNCNRCMDSYHEFLDWLNEIVALGGAPPHEWLEKRVERALVEKTGRYKVVVSAPLKLQLLRKTETWIKRTA